MFVYFYCWLHCSCVASFSAVERSVPMVQVCRRPSRFIDTSPKARERRRVRVSMRKLRENGFGKDQRSHRGTESRHARMPCCGRRLYACVCGTPKYTKPAVVRRILENYKSSEILAVEDTTDVGVFKETVANTILPHALVFTLAVLHSLFNQTLAWDAFIKEEVFLLNRVRRNVDYDKLRKVLKGIRLIGGKTRSSNYRALYLTSWSPDGGHSWSDPPSNAVDRDVLSVRLMIAAVPTCCLNNFEQEPTRTVWRLMNIVWRERLEKTCKGFGDYFHKCVLDRYLAARPCDPGFVSWWPTRCPAYTVAFEKIWPGSENDSEDEKLAKLWYLFRELRTVRAASISVILAHTCWDMKEVGGRSSNK